MARVLILDPDVVHANALAGTLAEHRHHATICNSVEAALGRLKESEPRFDVIILVLLSNRREDWDLLALIPKVTLVGRNWPMVLCLSRVYCGPHTRLAAERKGARLVYEQPI